MPLVSLRQLLNHAAEHSYGLPAFNVNNMEQVIAIMEAARETDSPVIIQAAWPPCSSRWVCCWAPRPSNGSPVPSAGVD